MLLTVEVEAELMESSKRRAARQLAQRGKIPGFRPGKAPYDVIVRYYGEGAIVEQAMDLLIDEIYPKVLEQAEIEPAAPGSLEKIEAVDPPKLIFKVPLAPEVDLGDYRALRVPYQWSAPGEKELKATLDNLREMYTVTETVERPIQVGDLVVADVKGALVKAKNDDDFSARLSRTGLALAILKDEANDEWPFSGFSKELIGLKTGESKTIQHKFSKQAEDEALRGQTAQFEVTVKVVRSMTLPDLDDDFAKMTGQFDTLEELKVGLMESLTARSREDYDNQYYNDLINKVREGATIKYPPQLVEEETQTVLDDLRVRLEKQGIDLEAYLKMQNTDLPTFMEKEAKPIAIQRLERALILENLAKAEDIQLDTKSLQDELEQTFIEWQYEGFDIEKVEGGKKGLQKVAKALTMASAHRLLTRRTFERMKAIATGEFEREQAEAKKKPKKASTGKKSSKNAQAQAEGEEKALETEPTPSAEITPPSSSKESAPQAESE